MAPLTEKSLTMAALPRQASEEERKPLPQQPEVNKPVEAEKSKPRVEEVQKRTKEEPPPKPELKEEVKAAPAPSTSQPATPEATTSKPEVVSCYRSAGSISVPRRLSNPNGLQLMPKLPDGDTSAKDEIRQRLKFGFAKVKAANRFKKVGAAATLKPKEEQDKSANSDVKSAAAATSAAPKAKAETTGSRCDKVAGSSQTKKAEASRVDAIADHSNEKKAEVPKAPTQTESIKKETPASNGDSAEAAPVRKLSLKEQAGIRVRRKATSNARPPSLPVRPVPEIIVQPKLPGLKFASDVEDCTASAIRAEDLVKPTMSDLYGAVEWVTEKSDSVEKIERGTKPVVHLCLEEEPDERSVESINSEEEDRKLKQLREQMNARRELRELRRTSREESSSAMVSRRSSVSSWRSEALDEEREVEAKAKAEDRQRKRSERSCKKHSKCHCYLFALETVGFYAVN